MNFGATPTTTTATTTTASISFGLGTTGQNTTFASLGGGDAGTKAADNQAATKGFTFGVQSAVTTQPLFGAQLGTKTTTVAPSIITTTQQETKGFSFGTTTTSAPSLSFGIQASAAPTTATTSKASTTDTIATEKTATTASLTSTTKTTDSGASTQIGQINFSQLEEHINKWTLELEEQEKVFTNQATQINAWDKLLISNNDKIIALNDTVQKVKAEQQTLEQELEFIATQHSELEESIGILQKDFHNTPQVDVERSQVYHLVENLDTQLKQMSEDLKEVIDYLNEANKAQDINDPIVQIGKILNAHMSSLQWIEGSLCGIATKIDDVTKMHESLRRAERSFRLTYYD